MRRAFMASLICAGSKYIIICLFHIHIVSCRSIIMGWLPTIGIHTIIHRVYRRSRHSRLALYDVTYTGKPTAQDLHAAAVAACSSYTATSGRSLTITPTSAYNGVRSMEEPSNNLLISLAWSPDFATGSETSWHANTLYTERFYARASLPP